MSRLIIVEGPDECGKTTLAQSICNQRSAMYFHCTASKNLFPGLMDYHQNIMEMVEINMKNGLDVVLDRFWPSEVVYGLHTFRPNSGYNPSKFISHIKALGGLYIYCFSQNGWARYSKGHIDPAHSLNKKEYNHVYNTYKQLYEQSQNKDNVVNYILEEEVGPGRPGMFDYIQRIWNHESFYKA